MFCPIPSEGRRVGPDDALSGSDSGLVSFEGIVGALLEPRFRDGELAGLAGR